MMNIRGSGGGGKSSSGGGVAEDPNTLTSVALAQIVEAISVGEIGGLVNNEYSIYLDGVALRDLSGTPNYKPFTWAFRLGTQDQSVLSGFNGTQQITDVSTKVTVSAGALIRPIPDQFASAVRVTMTFPSLTSTTNKGEIQGTTVQFKVGVRPVGGTFTYSAVQTINGKSSGEYQYTVEVSLLPLGPSASGYEVSVVRVTPDSTSALLANDSYWSDYVIVHYENFTYPNTALIGIQLDSRYFSSVPDRTYHVYGRIIRVPKNYDPITRTYATTGAGTTSGAWDGSFKWAYSNNPAWVYYDMLTNTMFGLGKRLNVDSNGYTTYVDRFSLYVIGQYCDELVPTGVGNTVVGDQVIGGYGMNGKALATVGVPQGPVEPRFTFNGVFNTTQDAYKVLQQLTSAFRGMSYWAQSQVMATQDAPQDVEFIVNNSNVKNGRFQWQGSARSDRHTVCTVGWNDPAENFKQKFEYVQDLTAVKQWGVRQDNIVQFGCTSQGQARRAGLWLLYTEKYEVEAVTFTAGTDMAYILPGMVGEISDKHKAGVRWGGRALAGTTTSTLVMDAPLALTAGQYTVKVKLPDGTLGESQVVLSSDGTFSSLTLSTALALQPINGAIWALSSNTLSSRTVRCVARTYDTQDSYTFTCVDHNPSKYQAIEDGLEIQQYKLSVLSTTVTATVTNLKAVENSYKPAVGQPTKVTALTSWDAVSDPLHAGYIVEMASATSGAYSYSSGLITDNFYVFSDAGVDNYNITVVAVNQFGKQGIPTRGLLTVTGIDSTPPADVTGLRATQDNIAGVTLIWDIVDDYISGYEVRVGNTFSSATVIYTGTNNLFVVGPIAAVATKFWVSSIDTSGNYSLVPPSVTVTPSAPGAATMGRSLSGITEILTWNIPTSLFAIDHYQLSYGATYASSSMVNSKIKGTSLQVTLTYTGSRTYWLVAVDTAGNLGTPSSLTVTVVAPAAPVISQAFKNTDEVLSWTVPASSIPVASYQVLTGATFASATLVATTVTNSLTRNVNYQGNRIYYVVATDQAGNVGTPGSMTTLVVGPNPPTITYALASVNEALSWTDAQNSLPINGYEVRFGATWASATVLADTATPSLTRRVDYGGSRTYWVAGIDTAGNYGTPASIVCTITLPGDVQGKRVDVVDNNALIYWTPPIIGSLPIDRYEVRKGSTWAGGTVVGSNGNSTFAAVFEQQAGNYQYWITGVDSAGNFGSSSSISATINQPPDYILRVDIISTFSGTLTNLAQAPDLTGLIGPINTTESFGQHFGGAVIVNNVWDDTLTWDDSKTWQDTNTGNVNFWDDTLTWDDSKVWKDVTTGGGTPSYSTPQQQVDFGYPLYANPSLATGSYDETIDYGTALTSSTVTVTPSVTVIQGTVASSCQIYVKLNAGDAWTAAGAGSTSYLASNFRYVRVVISFTCTAGANLAELNALEIKLSSKRISDGGSATITNATTGVAVLFNRTFISAETPQIQPAGTIPLIGIVDYAGTTNPTGFTGYLYTLAGAKTTGSFSWSASGF